jgi:hypothetical protein
MDVALWEHSTLGRFLDMPEHAVTPYRFCHAIIVPSLHFESIFAACSGIEIS